MDHHPHTALPTRLLHIGSWLIVLVLLTAGYLIAGGSPTLFYTGATILYLGLSLMLWGVWGRLTPFLLRESRTSPLIAFSLLTAIGLSVGTGVALLFTGALYPYRVLTVAHFASTFAAGAGTLAWVVQQKAFRDRPVTLRVIVGTVAVAVLLPIAGVVWPTNPQYIIRNPGMPAATMQGEAMGGSDGPFFPSASETAHEEHIPSDYLMSSESCGQAGCHVDVYDQWTSSMHHLSSFNNQYYRKSIEYMQEMVGTKPAQWCSGCHDPALLFAGKMNQPVADFIDTPEAHAGLGCVACHSITKVNNTMGNGGYVIEYPELHDLAESDNPAIKTVHDAVIRLNPKGHRAAFLKPFHREQPAEFCSSCHKVHLDQPVNNYRWIRGFNSYDNWQASGVSGQGARSFYEPEAPMTCLSCHMPLVPSEDPASKNGFIRSHRFAAANTAVSTANLDTVQVNAVKAFLQSGQVSIDVFAVSEPEAPRTTVEALAAAGEDQPELSSTFAAGEEEGMTVGSGSLTRTATQVYAPLEDGDTVLQRGTSARLDVVLRTLRVGHTFPAGTVDAQEVWIELKAVDSNDRMIFWSGWVAEDGTGPVDSSAHFYRSLMVDANGNPINKRNAWASRSVVYVNLIPPGAANVAHYRLDVPEDVGETVTITAKVQYRKFNWWHNQYSYRGIRDPNDPDPNVSPHYDDGRWIFEGDLSQVSGQLKDVPVIPIVTMAEDQVTLRVTDDVPDYESSAEPSVATRTRWNDYGIGLMLEGDLKGAEQAFRRVTELEPSYADGWVNMARVYLQEGNLDAAAEILAAAEPVRPGFYKTRYFRGLLHKAYGEYPEALTELKAVSEEFPTDRVVLNDIGRVYFLNAEPEKALPYFEQVLAIDSEDLMAHYNLMLCYRAMGDLDRSKEHEIRYLRYKADESSRAIARIYRQRHPHDNNEASPIHEHRSFYSASPVP